MNQIKSHIVYVGDRRVHYRRAGTGPAVVMLHLSPSWAKSLDEYTAAFAVHSTAIALDTPGYGLSDLLDIENPNIGDFADALRDTLDTLEIEQCALFGSHTGATIAVEFALRYPARCSVAIFDGYPGFTPAQRADYLAHHFGAYVPRADGGHLLETWHKMRSVFLFSPPFTVSKANRADRAPLPPDRTQDVVLPRLMAGTGYMHAYRGVFEYDGLSRLKDLEVPTCFAARRGDSLMQALDRLGDLPARCWMERLPRSETETAQRYSTIIREHAPATDAPAATGPTTPTTPGLTYRFVSIGETQVMVRLAGQGEGTPLVVVPHLPGSGSTWEALLPGLSLGRAVYVIDLPGNGDSDDMTGPLSVAGFVHDLGTVMDALDLPPVALLGHGSGASVATAFVAARAHRVARLILRAPMCLSDHDRNTVGPRYAKPIVPAADASHLVGLWFALRGEQLFWPWYDELVETIRDTEPDLDPAVLTDRAVAILKHYKNYEPVYRAMFADDLRARLKTIGIPTLVCSTERDVFHSFSSDAAALVPCAKYAVLPDDAALSAAVSGFLSA